MRGMVAAWVSSRDGHGVGIVPGFLRRGIVTGRLVTAHGHGMVTECSWHGDGHWMVTAQGCSQDGKRCGDGHGMVVARVLSRDGHGAGMVTEI